MKRRRMCILLGFLLILSILVRAYYDTNYFKVAELQLTTTKLDNGQSFQILQITDLHNKQFGTNNEKLIHKVKDIDADAIVITGDLIDRKTSDLQPVFTLIERLKEITSPIYFVSGNHEWENEEKAAFFAGLTERGIQILDNQNQTLEIDGITVNLTGVADLSTNHDNIVKAMKGIHIQDFTVLLSHTPPINSYDEYSDMIDIVLSGHTHGGQIRVPFIGAIVAPEQGLFPKHPGGLVSLYENKQIYIDSGLGTSNVPIRLFNQSQMTLITVVGENK
ncbi:metallophosphoesterase [Gracilibacillus sp. S3-1-1]|uniref:Metallophosphoesterase n=1 Tax=Gracilibacillus pellucidus TaxID=3095368 RepID=A0ACC6M4U2_9BACI|nr:metallophosphoesterase [Gracilibacillus sp. S3-1-1]MDX8045920.1 metallophosphoesterase [Gracilibacillus sp. S3-1-1]